MKRLRITSITDRLVLYYVILGISSLAIIGYLSFYISKNALLERTFDQLTSVRVVKKDQIESWFAERMNEMKFLKTVMDSKTGCDAIISGSTGVVDKFLATNKHYQNAYILDADNKLKSITSEGKVLDSIYSLQIIEKIREKSGNISEFTFIDLKIDRPTIFLFSAISGKPGRYLIFEMNFKDINRIMLDNNPENGLGNSGESYLVGDDLLMRSDSRFVENALYRIEVDTKGVQRVKEGLSGTDIFPDYRGIVVLSSYSSLNVSGLNWILLAEIDNNEVELPIIKIRNTIIFFTIIVSIFVFIFVYILSKRISNPIINLTRAVKSFGETGDTEKLEIDSNDEIRLLTDSFGEMTSQLKQKEKELEQERMLTVTSVIDAQEEERERLARELHDSLGQRFIALKLMLENIEPGNPENNMELVKKVQDAIDSSVNEIRQISNNLMPAALKQFGLVTAIKNICTDLNQFSNIKAVFEQNGKYKNENKKITIYVYRIVQEAINNIVKHSGADKVNIYLENKENSLILVIEDNGRGFDNTRPGRTSGNGLYNIKERARLINAALDIDSNIDKGTKITLRLSSGVIENG